MSAERKPNMVDELRRACQRWRMIALFSVAALAVVSVSLGALLYGESAAKREAWAPSQQMQEELRVTREKALMLADCVLRLPRRHAIIAVEEIATATLLRDEEFQRKATEQHARDLLRRLSLKALPSPTEP